MVETVGIGRWHVGAALVVAGLTIGCAIAADAKRDEPGKSGPRTFWVAPKGSDDAKCTADAPCRTLDLGRLGVKAGDTVIARDGTYGRLRIICGAENPALSGGRCDGKNANAPCGTAGAPITIRAENERMARLEVDGSQSALHVEGCQHLVLEGFDTATADNVANTRPTPTVGDFRNSNVTFRRILGWGTNRCGNNHVFQSVGSKDSVFEENEAWNHSRHAFSCSGSDRITYRRNYVNNNGVVQSSDSSCLDKGKPRGGTSRESIALYPCSNSLLENNIIEGVHGWGINVEGAAWSMARQRPSSGNKVLGNIVANTYLGMKVFTRDGVPQGIADNVVRHFLALHQVGSFGIRDSVSVNTLYDRVTVFAGRGAAAGMVVDDPCTSPPCRSQLGCNELKGDSASVTISNSAFCEGLGGAQLYVHPCSGAAQRKCTLSNVHAYGGNDPLGGLAAKCDGSGGDECDCSRLSKSPCKGLGVDDAECVAVWPGSEVGADIRCRTENGKTLGGAPNGLWAQPGESPTPTTTCTGPTPPGRVTPCLGGFRFCGAVVKGKNDQADNCRTFAERHLNHRADGKGCPLSAIVCP